jgi:hypothetical protein
MAQVEIGGETYEVYADIPDADAYLEASVGEAADAWRDADEVSKARALVSGTRAIDAQTWKGAKTDPDQPLAFPRTGLSYPDGTPVDPDVVPPEVVTASIELAAMLNAGISIYPAEARATVARRLKAGSVEIENFRQFGYLGIFPSAIMRLLGFWLIGAGAQGLGGSQSYGTCGKSAFREPQYKPARGW